MSQPTLVNTYAQFPFTLADGRGARVRDTDGREYWDFYGGHAVALLGQAHPAVTGAIAEQAARLTFCSNVVPLEIRTRAAERLCAFAPKGSHTSFSVIAAQKRMRMRSSSPFSKRAQANRRAARRVPRPHVSALAATAKEQLRRPFEGLLCPTLRLRPNVLDDVSAIDERVAAVIVEPIQSTAGVVELQPEFLKALRRRCDEIGRASFTTRFRPAWDDWDGRSPPARRESGPIW